MKYSRRTILLSACFGVINSIYAKNKCSLTPMQPLGPFFKTTDLSHISDMTNRGKAKGKVIHVKGLVKDNTCKPYSNSKLTIWQANSHGKYNHKGDLSQYNSDKHFNGYMKIKSDNKGFYKFTTIVPGSYKISNTIRRPPHIHIFIETETGKSLITQLYFKDHPMNRNDFLFNNAPNNGRLELDLNLSSDSFSNSVSYDFII